jgi:N-acyl-D-aspartate/D-glutamate deacylase
MGLSHEALKNCLSDTSFRQGVKNELAQATTFRLFNNEWDKVHVVQTAKQEHQKYEQHSVAELAQQLGVAPLDFVLDLALAEDLQAALGGRIVAAEFKREAPGLGDGVNVSMITSYVAAPCGSG